MEETSAQAVLDTAFHAFVSMDSAGRIAYWNPRAETMFGLRRVEALGRDLADTIIPERMRAAHREGLRRVLETGEGPILDRRLSLSAIRAGGEEFPVELTVSAVEGSEGMAFHAFLADVSEREQMLERLEISLRGNEDRLEAILDSLAEAVTIRGADERIIHANRAALTRLGFSSAEELAGADPRELMAQYIVTAADGSPLAMEDLPSVRALRGQGHEPLLMRNVSRTTGMESWVVLKSRLLRGVNGEPDAAVTIIEDVTAAKRAELRASFLAHAGEILASSLDYQQTLRNVGALAVPQVADWCAIDLLDPDGDREQVVVAHSDPAKLALAERLRAYEPDEVDPEQGVGLVLRTGQPVVYPEVPDELLVAAARDEEHLALLREVGFRSVLLVPLVASTGTLGVLTLVNSESGRTFVGEDVDLARQLASRAAVAVENARLYTERSEVARTLQESLLPEGLPEIPGWEIATIYRPAGHGSEVGGDFYDLWPVGEDWMIMVGDATGKGVAAASITSLVRHTAWTASEFEPSPAAVLGWVDRALKRRGGLSLCTALCLRLRGGQGTVSSAGHPLLLCSSGGGVRSLGRYGPLLGAFPNAQWREDTIAVREGGTLIAYTDGVTDTVGEGGERFGQRRLEELLEEIGDAAPQRIADRLLERLTAFQVGAQADDTAVLIMRRRIETGSFG